MTQQIHIKMSKKLAIEHFMKENDKMLHTEE